MTVEWQSAPHLPCSRPDQSLCSPIRHTRPGTKSSMESRPFELHIVASMSAQAPQDWGLHAGALAGCIQSTEGRAALPVAYTVRCAPSLRCLVSAGAILRGLLAAVCVDWLDTKSIAAREWRMRVMCCNSTRRL